LFMQRVHEEVAFAKAEGVLGGVPSSALATVEKNRSCQLFGLAGLVMFGLVGVHKWLLGDATTWRKEEALAVWLFWALFFTWEPTGRVFKGEASVKLVSWLILAWLYFAVIAASLAVPAMGAVVSGFNPLLVGAIVASPAIVFGACKVLTRLASRSR
jgi:hypothetical protein